MPFQQALADLSTGHIAGLTALPHLRDVGIDGPYKATGVGDTPSRRKILVCRPSGLPTRCPARGRSSRRWRARLTGARSTPPTWTA